MCLISNICFYMIFMYVKVLGPNQIEKERDKLNLNQQKKE